ncbi:MAG: radical SAM/SPASM domain-containing protein [Desulfovibrionaceae bacterium]
MSKYYMPEPGQSAIKRLYRLVRHKHRARPSFPSHIQIQTDSRCNAKCVFCGYKNTLDLPHGAMDDELYRKIIDECGRHLMSRISPYLMNEPLLDKKMPERIAYITKRKSFRTKSRITTNGALLTEDMSRGIIEAGLDAIYISVQGYSPETYKESMGLSLDRTLTNIDRFLDIKAGRGTKKPKVNISTVRTSIIDKELDYAREYWGKRDVTFRINNPDNRSGEDISSLAMTKTKLKRNCDLFLKQAYVLYNGDMVLCCHDWRRSVVLGNVRERSIGEIWNAPHFIELIREYFRGDFSHCAICRTCTVS